MAAKKKITNHVVIVLDASSSMYSIKKEAQNHFNEQVDSLKLADSKDIETDVTLIKFNGEVSEIYNSVPLKDVKKLTDKEYSPMGFTALYDAIAKGVELMEKKKDIKDKNTSVLLSIITDGEENSSVEHQGDKGRLTIKKKLEALQKTKRWTVSFLGANIDTEGVAVKGLGIKMNNVMSFQATSDGMRSASMSNNKGTSTYMVNLASAAVRGGDLSTDKFYDPEAENSSENTSA